MIRYEVENGITSLEVKGQLADTIAEIGQLIHLVHLKISNKDLRAGLAFEKIMKNEEFMNDVFAAHEMDLDILSAKGEEDE